MGLANFKRWKVRATNFAEASILDNWGPKIQRQIFEDLICDDARDKIDLKTCPSFAACMTALEAYWKTEWNKETLLTRYYHGRLERGEHLTDFLKRMKDLAEESGIGEATVDDHVKAKVFEALSQEQKSTLITLVPKDASLADVMNQLESVESWNKFGSDKELKKSKVLGVKPKEDEKPVRKGRGPSRSRQGGEETKEVFTVSWKEAWERRGIDFAEIGCLRCGSHEHKEGTCPEARKNITCTYCCFRVFDQNSI